MAGGMFAGHDECSGEVIIKNDKKFKLFYGMASKTAMEKHVGGVADYRCVANYVKILFFYKFDFSFIPFLIDFCLNVKVFNFVLATKIIHF